MRMSDQELADIIDSSRERLRSYTFNKAGRREDHRLRLVVGEKMLALLEEVQQARRLSEVQKGSSSD